MILSLTQNTLRATLTCFEVKQKEEVFENLGFEVDKSKIRKEIKFDTKLVYELIKNKFLQLDPTSAILEAWSQLEGLPSDFVASHQRSEAYDGSEY